MKERGFFWIAAVLSGVAFWWFVIASVMRLANLLGIL